jgi:hypothetical protein
VAPSIRAFRQVSPSLRAFQEVAPSIRAFRQVSPSLRAFQEVAPSLLALRGSLPSIRVLKDITGLDVQLVAAMAQVTASGSLPDTQFGTILSRSRERLLFANFVYCLVLSLVLLAYIRVMGEGKTDSEIFQLFTFAMGLGAHQIAKLARDAAFRYYDYTYPPQ